MYQRGRTPCAGCPQAGDRGGHWAALTLGASALGALLALARLLRHSGRAAAVTLSLGTATYGGSGLTIDLGGLLSAADAALYAAKAAGRSSAAVRTGAAGSCCPAR